MQTYPHVLLVEDNRSIASALCEALQTSFTVEVAYTGKAGLYHTDTNQVDLILLDLQLPDINGLDVCQVLRERGVRVPIIIISAEAKILSKISLLDAGADDYLTKPFSLGELKARMRTLLRKSAQPVVQPLQKTTLSVGALSLNQAKHEVTREGHVLPLRKKEFSLLECLMLNAGNVVSRQQLIDYAWPGADKPWANTIDVHIKFIRDKVDRSYNTKMIETVHGIGYRIVPSMAAAEAVAP